MIKLFDADNDTEIGEITEEQLEFLTENLVEESLDDYSWSIDAGAIASLEGSGADPRLVGILKRALGSRASIEIRHDPD
jgi:hypothetical protein